MDVVRNEKGRYDIIDDAGIVLNGDFDTANEAWEYMDKHYPGY